MPADIKRLTLVNKKIGRWTVPVLEYPNTPRPSFGMPIYGLIAHQSAANNEERQERLDDWKVKVASEVRSHRGIRRWVPTRSFAITLGLSFYPPNHGNRRTEVDNFVKPVIDAVAAGLFCDARTKLDQIQLWDYDDSNFNTLLFHRLADVKQDKHEGVAVFVSAK